MGNTTKIDNRLKKKAEILGGDLVTALYNGNHKAVKRIFNTLAKIPKENQSYKRAFIEVAVNTTKHMDNIKRMTPLMCAAKNGDTENVKRLLQNDAEIDTKNGEVLDASFCTSWRPEGWTALMFAAESGNEECVELLLDNGADVCTKGLNNGRSALILALQSKNLKSTELILEKDTDFKTDSQYKAKVLKEVDNIIDNFECLSRRDKKSARSIIKLFDSSEETDSTLKITSFLSEQRYSQSGGLFGWAGKLNPF